MRIVPEITVTGTLKQRKVELQREGYDPTQVAPPLYVRDDQAATYTPLTAERYRDIVDANVRL